MPTQDLGDVRRDGVIEARLLDYILQVTARADTWWQDTVGGTYHSRRGQYEEWRLRYDARRSTAGLYNDAKNDPFPRASNVGVGAEQIFGEFLTPLMLSNTHDLDPMLQALGLDDKPIDVLTSFHDRYHRNEVRQKRQMLEESIREVWRVGSVFHKWTWGSTWKQNEQKILVWAHPLSRQPVLIPNKMTGQPEPMPADPRMPKEAWPNDPATGLQLIPLETAGMRLDLLREGPHMSVVPVEQVRFPNGATTVDPNTWDWVSHNFTVTPWWFLGREGDPFDGKLQNLDKLWRHLKLNPNDVYRRPDGRLTEPIHVTEWQGKFPVTRSGKPVEIIALVVPEARLLLAWRPSRLPRRSLFNRQVWSRGQSPLGKGIPETSYGLRNALDASANQDLDSGNLYNHPPLILSQLAMIDDEDYETVGPGTQWVMSDINGAKFLAPPLSKRDPIARENWLMSMMQRLWGVTDLNLNAPTSSLSPNVTTATGVVSVLNQGNIKFGHLTKRITEVDTLEYQFVHDLFGELMASAKKVSVNGQMVSITPAERKTFFSPDARIVARGDGITTNPMLRQQVLTQAYMMFANEPFIGQDLEVRKDLVEQTVSALGLKLEIKDSEAIQMQQILQQVAAHPVGQQKIKEAVAQIEMEKQMGGANGQAREPSSVPQGQGSQRR